MNMRKIAYLFNVFLKYFNQSKALTSKCLTYAYAVFAMTLPKSCAICICTTCNIWILYFLFTSVLVSALGIKTFICKAFLYIKLHWKFVGFFLSQTKKKSET